MVLIDEDLLILEIFVLFLFDFFCGLHQSISEFLSAMVRLTKLINDMRLLQFNVFVELKFFVKGIHSGLEMVVMAAQSGFNFFHNLTMLRPIVYDLKVDVVGTSLSHRR